MTQDLASLKREARLKSTSAGRLLELAALDPQLSRSVAKSKYASADVLEQLSRSGDMPTRRAVAANPVAPLGLLEKLAKDHQWTVLKAVATNPSTPEHLLMLLASHKRDSVRQSLFARSGLPLTDRVLEVFLHSSHIEDRRKLASYSPISPYLLEQLSEETDLEVRHNLVWWHGKALSQELLRECAEAEPHHLREVAARYVQDPALLAGLLQDQNLGVRLSAAQNGSTPMTALMQATQDILADLPRFAEHEPLARALSRNTTLPDTLRRELRKHLDRPLKHLVLAEDQLKGEGQ